MLSCSAVVGLQRDGRSWVREGKSSRSASLFCFTGTSKSLIQLGCRALGGFDPGRGSATKHPGKGEMCTHRGCDSLTLLCAGVSPLAAAPAVCQQGPWQCSLGHRLISAHANNLEVSPGVGQLVPGSALGSILCVPIEVAWQSLLGLASRGPGTGRVSGAEAVPAEAFQQQSFPPCPKQRTNVAGVIDRFCDSPLSAWQEKTKRSFNLSKWF